MPGDVYCVIPTFTPESTLLDLAAGLSSQCPVLVVDDASPCTSDGLLRQVEALPGVGVIKHSTNAGIGRGLNDGLTVARDAGCAWLLTVDQDTDVPAGYVTALIEAARRLSAGGVPLGALGAGSVTIAGASMRYPGHALDCQGTNVASTEEIVQSGTLWNINAITAFGGFNETFGMDAVDAHACLSLREAGLVVATVADLEINHRIGSAQPVTIKGRNPVFLTGHSPERRTLMVRNRLALFPSEFRQSPRHAFRTLRRVLINQAAGLMVETDKLSKARGSLRGLIPSRKR